MSRHTTVGATCARPIRIKLERYHLSPASVGRARGAVARLPHPPDGEIQQEAATQAAERCCAVPPYSPNRPCGPIASNPTSRPLVVR